jgi:hypothetical protein
MNSDGLSIASVVGRLKEARLRLVAQGVLNALFWALSAGLLILTVLELLRRLRPDWWADVFGAQGMIPQTIAVASAALVLAGGMVVAALRAPSIEQLARRADQILGLRERISTAIEIESRTGNRPVVVAAMIADAARHGSAIRPAALAAYSLPRTALVVPIAAIAAAAVMFVLPVHTASVRERVEARLSTTFGAGEGAATADDISQVAGVIGDEAAARGDAYMEAVGNTLDDLAERVTASPQMTRGDVIKELDALMEHAAAAGTGWRDSTGERVPLLFEALENAIALPPVAGSTNAEVAEPQLDEAPGYNPELTNSNAPPPSGIDSVLEDLEWRNDAAQSGTMSWAGERAEIPGFARTVQPDAAPPPKAGQRKALDDAPALETEDAGDGANHQVAGDGTQAIGAVPVAQQIDLQTTSELALSGTDSGEGRSIKVEFTPQTEVTAVTEESLAVSTEAWRKSPESDARRYSIGIDDRDAVSRYMRALRSPAKE